MAPRSQLKSILAKGNSGILDDLKITKPIIAAVNGMAFGLGMEITLACDIRIASHNSEFALTEVKRGIIPSAGGTQRLPRLIPRAIASEMLLLGQSVNAREAYRWGLINLIVPLAELLPITKQWAARICDNGPLAARGVKEAISSGLEMSLDEGIALEKDINNRLADTTDAREGYQAFLENRKPEFEGE